MTKEITTANQHGMTSLPATAENIAILERKNASIEAILYFSGRGIAEASAQEIKQLLAIIGVTAGINIPSEAETLVIIDWFKRKLPNYSIEEVKHAFELYAENQLVVKFEHYGKFSVRFIMAVIEGYKSRRSKAMKEATKLLEPPEKPIETNAKKVFFNLTDYVKATNTLPEIAPWDVMYGYLIEEEIVTDSHKDTFIPMAEQKIKNNAMKSTNIKSYLKHNGDTDSVESYAVKLCVLDVLSNYLKK